MMLRSTIALALLCGIQAGAAHGADLQSRSLGMVMPVLLLEQFRWEAFSTPGASMSPTFKIGDMFMAWRRNYHVLPPQRGETTVFVLGDTAYVKRIMAIAGDRIALDHGTVILNGAPLARREIARDGGKRIFEERLPDGRVIHVAGGNGDFSLETMAEFTVPAGTVFVLGDNRTNSRDSRIPQVGPIPIDALRKHPAFIYWSGSLSRIGRSLSPEQP